MTVFGQWKAQGLAVEPQYRAGGFRELDAEAGIGFPVGGTGPGVDGPHLVAVVQLQHDLRILQEMRLQIDGEPGLGRRDR